MNFPEIKKSEILEKYIPQVGFEPRIPRIPCQCSTYLVAVGYVEPSGLTFQIRCI